MVTICVSMAVVGRDKRDVFCPGKLAISGMIFFCLVLFAFGATTAIFPAIAVVCVGLRERFLLVVGMSFLLPLLCGWCRLRTCVFQSIFVLSLLCQEPGRVFVWSLWTTVTYRLVPLPIVDYVTLGIWGCKWWRTTRLTSYLPLALPCGRPIIHDLKLHP